MSIHINVGEIMEYLLGIDIGGTHVKGGIVTGTTGKMDQRTIVYEKIDAPGHIQIVFG